jgi:hypothetical protein
MKRRNPDATLRGLDLLEESVHVLRLASPATLLCYYLGTIPFVLAALFFWSDMSRSGLAEQHLVPGALGLTALFVWMKLWQSVFALKLSAQIANEAPPKLSITVIARTAALQTFVHATGLFIIPIAAQILLPIAWVYAFYQNATILGLREPSAAALVKRSWKQACFAPTQNHSALSMLGLFGMFVFFNIAIAMLVTPRLLKMLAGVETPFTLSIWSSFNTTFLAAAMGITYLCLDPLIKAMYTLRCFYGESRTTGEDLRVTLKSFHATALALLVLFASAPVTTGQPPSSPPPTQASELDRSIDETLKRPEYTWRSPRPKRDTKAKDESSLGRRVRQWLKDAAKTIIDWMKNLFRSRTAPATPRGFSLSTEGMLYLLLTAVVAIGGAVVWIVWRARARLRDADLAATATAPMPDLASEDVTGEELPVDGWTQLALELLERGELRLAMRAFYFSSLAHLAARSLVSIAKFKSNRDYERELLRRSHALPEVTKTFSENVSVFDRVWYGMHDINADLLQHFRSNVERIREC